LTGTGKNDQIQGQGVQATTEGYKQSDGTSDYYKGPAYGPVSEDDTEEEGELVLLQSEQEKQSL